MAPRVPFVRAHGPFAFGSWWFGLVAIDPFMPFGAWESAGAGGVPTLLPPELADDRPTGGLQLDVEPRRARVYVDGEYAGRVEQFSGYYQHLDLPAGPHTIEVLEPGYDPVATYVVVAPGRTATYRAAMSRASNGS